MHPLRRLLTRASGHRTQLRLARLCSVLNKVFDLAPPALIGAAVDVVVNREDSLLADLGVVDVEHQLLVLGGLTALVQGGSFADASCLPPKYNQALMGGQAAAGVASAAAALATFFASHTTALVYCRSSMPGDSVSNVPNATAGSVATRRRKVSPFFSSAKAAAITACG